MSTSAQPLDAIAAIPMFSGVGKRQLKRLVDSGREVQHEPGRVLAQEGMGALAFHLVLEGTLEVVRGDAVLRELGPGDYFGEISMIDGKPRSSTVRAGTSVRTLAIPHAAFDKLLDDEPAVARALLVELCARLRAAEQRQS
ncbi:cyclic nucleotide-binding domain-containing protein [Nocardioides KLBMP 9356]|uniref:Cyclic nucleotide-binding domain-containing protein n=1 Tax=Nocardioides potassii TaxID=2911371 RepID=A0ABS9H6E6_9ACTN|nr:cyclic nucleotide-binding domain-containing protein [Nocardioides potassii]MCF6376807.1 cyclic nucleotide-binding domain-containing protein [Nocardioides potassii]